jgi:hypothetical protein
MSTSASGLPDLQQQAVNTVLAQAESRWPVWV